MTTLLPTSSVILAELLKMRKRWLIYILFLVLVLGAGVLIWLVGYMSWRSGDEFSNRPEALRTFTLPWSLVALLDTGQFWGAMLVGILAASTVATEYGWGTVRLAVSRGQTRAQYLTMKLVGIASVASIGMLGALAVGLFFSVLASNLAGERISFDVPNGPSFPDAVFMVIRAAYAVLPYGLLAFGLAVVSRSTTLGVAGIILFMFIESIMIAVLGDLGGIAPDIRAFLIGHNVSALLAANRIGSGEYFGLALRGTPEASQLPDPWIGALVIAVYCAIFLAISYYVFQKRDLGVESGGN